MVMGTLTCGYQCIKPKYTYQDMAHGSEVVSATTREIYEAVLNAYLSCCFGTLYVSFDG